MIFATMALWLTLLVSGSSTALSPSENLHLDNLIDENIVFECTEINPEVISGVLDASFIEVKIFQLFDRNCSSKKECGYIKHIVLKRDEVLFDLTGSDDLLPYVVPEFKLESAVEAKEFEKILDLVFPVFFSSGKEIYKEDNTWVFIRENSFGEKDGILVGVDSAGVILKIEDAQNIERKEQIKENGEVER